MIAITKEDVLNAFSLKQRKRNQLLYNYYKDTLFNQAYPAKYIAKKISQDLGISIEEKKIYLINKDIIKKHKSVLTSIPTAPIVNGNEKKALNEITNGDNKKIQNDTGNLIQETDAGLVVRNEKTGKEYIFKNADKFPKVNPYADL